MSELTSARAAAWRPSLTRASLAPFGLGALFGPGIVLASALIILAASYLGSSARAFAYLPAAPSRAERFSTALVGGFGDDRTITTALSFSASSHVVISGFSLVPGAALMIALSCFGLIIRRLSADAIERLRIVAGAGLVAGLVVALIATQLGYASATQTVSFPALTLGVRAATECFVIGALTAGVLMPEL
jgi:hypothetical protein